MFKIKKNAVAKQNVLFDLFDKRTLVTKLTSFL
jgi:hypothetical protein